MAKIVQTFKMPLAETFECYWRWALAASTAVGGYDSTPALEELIRIVKRAGNGATTSRSTDLADMVTSLQSVRPMVGRIFGAGVAPRGFARRAAVRVHPGPLTTR